MMAQMATEAASRKKLVNLFAAFNEGLDVECIEGILQTQEGNVNHVMPSSKHLESVDHSAHSGTVVHRLRRIDRGQIPRILNLLIKYGADITIRNSEGQTVLHSEIVEIYKYDSDWQPISKDSIINWVLSAHVEHSISQNPRDANGISHFDIACMYKHKQAINFFLENGVNVNQAINEDSRMFAGYTPLHFAAYHSCLHTMEKLLMCGADVSSKNAQGLTPLQMLIEKNLAIVGLKSNRSKRLLSEYKANQTMIRLLLTSAASNNNNNSNQVEQYGSGFSSFHAACSLEDISLADNLLAHVEDVNAIIDMNTVFRPGYSALHFAAHFSVDLVKLLLARGADILAQDASGVTPLDICLQAFGILDIRPVLRGVLVPDVVKNALADQAFQARLDNVFGAMLTEHTYQSFLDSENDVNRPIGNDSPIWPGCTMLHLAVLMSERARAVVSNKKPVDDWQNSQLIEECMMSGADCTVQDFRGSTPLHLAFYSQKRNSLRRLLSKHVETINPVDDNRVSHLHVALSEADYDTVGKLVLNGADVNLPTLRAIKLPRQENDYVYRDADMDIRPDDYDFDSKLVRTKEVVSTTINLAAGCTPLHMAVMFCSCILTREALVMVKLLLRNGASVNATNADGWSAVHTAMLQSPLTGIGKALFTHSTRLQERVVDDVGLSHLHVACYVGSLKGVRKLIKLGSDVNRTVAADLELAGHFCQNKCYLLCRNAYAGFTPLHFALGNYTTKIASELLAAGANVSSTSPHVVSPLFQALSGYRCNRFVDLFVAHLRGSEDLQMRLQEDTGMTLLHVYALTMDLDAIEESLDAGLLDVNAKIRSDSSMWPGCTALHMWVYGLAKCRERLWPKSVLKVLLDAGADVTLPDARLNTPLHLLNSSHVTTIDEYFLAESKMMLKSQKDFSVNPVNSTGFTHFHISCRVNDLQSAKEFLRFGVDVNQRVHDFLHCEEKGEKFGCTPLHLVVGERSGNSTHQPNRMEMIDLLLENGADPGASDILGNTPLHGIAKVRFQRLELVEKLLRAGGALDAVNVLGETPFSVLLKSYRVSAEEIEFFLQQGCRMNVYNPVDNTGLLALPVLHNGWKYQTRAIYKMCIRNPEIENVDDLGRTAIHNVVSARVRSGWVTASLYPEVIDRLVKQGCDVNAQDRTGKTPLHVAAQFKNKAGLIALLDTGADLNILDAKGWSVLDYAADCCQGNSTNKDARYHVALIKEILIQLKKLHVARITVQECNHNHMILKLLKKFDMSFPPIERSKAQLERTKQISIGNLGSLKLYDFLSETGAVAAYSTMSRLERRAVDKFFTTKNKVLDDFDEVKGLLKLQYRKSVIRAGLITFAMDSLRRASGIPLPEICCNRVLRYLALSDVQNLVASTEN